MTPRELAEYTALRATIRGRGTARVWLFAGGLAAWAALTMAAAALALAPVMTLLPLVVLAATFEGVLALHVTVERIGRYLLVFHDDGWERAAGAFGRPAGALAVDPLFAVLFVIAAFLNIAPLLVTPPAIVQEAIVAYVPPALFVARVVWARSAARRQREIDTARFEQLRDDAARHR